MYMRKYNDGTVAKLSFYYEDVDDDSLRRRQWGP